MYILWAQFTLVYTFQLQNFNLVIKLDKMADNLHNPQVYCAIRSDKVNSLFLIRAHCAWLRPIASTVIMAYQTMTCPLLINFHHWSVMFGQEDAVSSYMYVLPLCCTWWFYGLYNLNEHFGTLCEVPGMFLRNCLETTAVLIDLGFGRFTERKLMNFDWSPSSLQNMWYMYYSFHQYNYNYVWFSILRNGEKLI